MKYIGQVKFYVNLPLLVSLSYSPDKCLAVLHNICQNIIVHGGKIFHTFKYILFHTSVAHQSFASKIKYYRTIF